MAERRMFAKNVIDSDLFLDMPLSTQALYFHLAMRADDDGFVNNPKKILRMIGADDDSLKLLCIKKFLIPFENGVVVIRHWRVHNYIRSDRYKETVYQDEKNTLNLQDNGVYQETDTFGIPNAHQMDTQVRLGKDSIGKVNILLSDDSNESKKIKRFVKPTVEEIKAYCTERNNNIDAETFFDFYEANGWVQGRSGKPLKDWKAAVRTWEKNRKAKEPEKRIPTDADYDFSDWYSEGIK